MSIPDQNANVPQPTPNADKNGHPASRIVEAKKSRIPTESRVGWDLKNKLLSKFGQSDDDLDLGKQEEKVSQAEQLVNIAKCDGQLWHTGEFESYITLQIKGGAKVNLRVDSTEFRRQLSYLFYLAIGKIPTSHSLDNAVETLGGLAIHEGELHNTFLRVAEKDGKIYVDIGDPMWRCIQIDPLGWSIITDPPVKFRRSSGMTALPEPVRNGNIGPLRDFVNLDSLNDFILTLSFLVMTLHPKGEFPIFAVYGQQGSSKSTFARILRSLCDPNSAPLRSTPRTEDDFSIMAYNNWIMVFDNLSFVPDWLSDALCRLASGGANAKRKNYSDKEEVLISYLGPAIINGVVDLARRPDLLDRCLLIELPVLEKRISKSEFWNQFELQKSTIFGGILDAVVQALACKEAPTEDLPRMAEFAVWAMAAESSLAKQWNDYADSRGIESERWQVGDFLRAYRENICKAVSSAIEQSPIVRHLIAFINDRGGYVKLSPTDLFNRLKERASEARESIGKESGWPQSSNSFGGALQRLAPVLMQVGFRVYNDRETGGNRDRFWECTNLQVFPNGSPPETFEQKDDAGFSTAQIPRPLPPLVQPQIQSSDVVAKPSLDIAPREDHESTLTVSKSAHVIKLPCDDSLAISELANTEFDFSSPEAISASIDRALDVFRTNDS